MKITKDMLIGEVLDIDSSAAEYFFEIGMVRFCEIRRIRYLQAALQPAVRLEDPLAFRLTVSLRHTIRLWLIS